MNNRNTIIYVKVNGNRPKRFQDPVPFEWNREKEKQLWSIISKLDNYQDQIDWEDLSRNLEAPEYFLKRKSYKLSANHLKLLEQQIEKQIKGPSDEQVSDMLKFEADQKFQNEVDLCSLTSTEKSDSRQPVVDDTASKAFQHLQTSKIINRGQEAMMPQRDGRKLNNNIGSDSDISSSLSISTSALEEALMDRLHL